MVYIGKPDVKKIDRSSSLVLKLSVSQIVMKRLFWSTLILRQSSLSQELLIS